MCGEYSDVSILACAWLIVHKDTANPSRRIGILNQIKTPEGACESNTVRFRGVSLPATMVRERQYRGLNVLIRTASCGYSHDRRISYPGFLGVIFHIFKKE